MGLIKIMHNYNPENFPAKFDLLPPYSSRDLNRIRFGVHFYKIFYSIKDLGLTKMLHNETPEEYPCKERYFPMLWSQRPVPDKV